MRAVSGNTAHAADTVPTVAELRDLMGSTQPVRMASERVIPVVGEFEDLFDGGLRRGITVGVGGVSGITSLGLSMCAGATEAGLWLGFLNVPSMGWAAASELGVDLDRVVSVEVPGQAVPEAVAVMVDVFDMVLVDGLEGLSGAQSQRLRARVREQGSVLLVLRRPKVSGGSTRRSGSAGWSGSAEWSGSPGRSGSRGYSTVEDGSGRSPWRGDPPDISLDIDDLSWKGLSNGGGRLVSRRLKVTRRGRRGMSAPRSAERVI